MMPSAPEKKSSSLIHVILMLFICGFLQTIHAEESEYDKMVRERAYQQNTDNLYYYTLITICLIDLASIHVDLFDRYDDDIRNPAELLREKRWRINQLMSELIDPADHYLIPQFQLLGQLSLEHSKLANDPANDRGLGKTDTVNWLHDKIKDTVNSYQQKFSYRYYWIAFMTSGRTVNNNAILPWREREDQLPYLEKLTTDLMAATNNQDGFFFSGEKYQTAHFFHQALGLDYQAAYKIMDDIRTHHANDSGMSQLIRMTASMVTRKAEQWQKRVTHYDPDLWFASVAHKTVSLLFHILSVPCELNHQGCEGWLAFQQASLSLGSPSLEDFFQSGTEPFPIPKKFRGWATGKLDDFEKQLDALRKYLEINNEAHHAPASEFQISRWW